MKTSFMVAIFACLAGVATPVSALDWPQWRGPGRDGLSKETGLLQEWPQGGPQLAWKSVGLGGGYSTVAVVKDRIYTTGDRKDSSFVVALDAGTGKQVWAAKLGKPGAPGWGGFAGPRATPTIDGAGLFVMDQWGQLLCLDLATGNELWRKDLVKDLGGSRPEWGFSESPLVDGDRVVVTPGGDQGAIAALDRKSGAVIWQSKGFTDAAQYSSLVPVDHGGVKQYVQLTSESVAGVAAEDGRLLWRVSRKGKTAVIPTPVLDNGYVYVTSGYGVGCNLFKVDVTGKNFSAQQVYANKDLQNHHGGVIKIGGSIYGHSDSKGWVCQDFLTGAIKWEQKGQVGKGSVVYADNRLYLRQEDAPGTIALIEASEKGYVEHGRFNPPDRSDKKSWPHPVVANGRLYIRDQDVLLCYDVAAK